MDTVTLFGKQYFGEATATDYSEWACHLLENGLDSESVCDLAANPELHWQDRDALVIEIFQQLGLKPGSSEDSADQLEKLWLDQWLFGIMDYRELAKCGRKLWRHSGCLNRFRLWVDIDEDLTLLEEGIYGPIFFTWNARDLAASFRSILQGQGKLTSTTPPAP